ncbi:MAG: hypothetical protein HRT40_09040 [Campylobacteraceae bacterium]|nr:hypothetical protein [Campylobacteraceae bacterium]
MSLSTLGDKKAIQVSIDKFSSALKSLKSKSSLTDDDDKQMKVINQSIVDKIIKKDVLQKEIVLNDSIYKITNGLNQKIEHFIIDEFSNIDILEVHKPILEKHKKLLSKELVRVIENYKEINPLKNKKLLEKSIEIDTEIEILKKSLDPYNEKIQDKNKYLGIEKVLKEEQLQLKNILAKELEIVSQKSKLNINKFIVIYKELFDVYEKIKTLNEPYKNIGKDLELITDIDFNTKKFFDNFSSFITKNQSMDKIFTDSIFTMDSKFLYKKVEHLKNVEFILNKIFSMSITFNKKKDLKDMIKALFDDYFEITYDLKQGNDLLNNMSPGKKGIVLFQLFLEVSSLKVPILIDQPEDNLDNRTVYKTLNEFIKNKKIDRQIIMVSHNSNLVVSTDSENIIVANQNGLNSGMSRFDYINGALEETKIKDENEPNILKQQGIREHVCEILEGGVEAFKKREEKYNI